MLELATNGTLPALMPFCEGTLLGTYLACRARCYRADYDFVRFWYAKRDGRIRAIVGATDGAATVLADGGADFEELGCFLAMQGFSSIMTDEMTASRCSLTVRQRKTAFRFAGALPPAQDTAADADMKAVYRLIAESIPGSFADTEEAYLRFLSDYTFRKNRGAARLCAVTEGENVLAAALTAAESDTAAVLSGVAVRAADRGKGYGKRVVLGLVHTLEAEGKTADVIALNENAEAFYRALGFTELQKIVYCTSS